VCACVDVGVFTCIDVAISHVSCVRCAYAQAKPADTVVDPFTALFESAAAELAHLCEIPRLQISLGSTKKKKYGLAQRSLPSSRRRSSTAATAAAATITTTTEENDEQSDSDSQSDVDLKSDDALETGSRGRLLGSAAAALEDKAPVEDTTSEQQLQLALPFYAEIDGKPTETSTAEPVGTAAMEQDLAAAAADAESHSQLLPVICLREMFCITFPLKLEHRSIPKPPVCKIALIHKGQRLCPACLNAVTDAAACDAGCDITRVTENKRPCLEVDKDDNLRLWLKIPQAARCSVCNAVACICSGDHVSLKVRFQCGGRGWREM
jgi:hypothetical protein